MARKVARYAPTPPKPKTLDELTEELNRTLREQFCLAPIPTYSVFVEGWTDRNYLERAAQLAGEYNGEDLLAVPGPSGQADRIALLTPGKPGNPSRGGVPQLVRLADALRVYIFHLEMYAICFVFDHDEAGIKAQQEIRQHGYEPDSHSLTLDPRHHPGSCAQKQVVIEDLLTLDLQRRFFEKCPDKWCTVSYEAGALRRFQWAADTKSKLQEFACREGSWDDFREVARVLQRVRSVFNLPANTALSTRMDSAS